MEDVSVVEEEVQSLHSHHKERGALVQAAPVGTSEPGPAQTQAESLRQRPVSPVSSCVSLKSDWSIPLPPNFSPEPGPAQSLHAERPVSPVSSCVSLKSDRSIPLSPNFSPEPGPAQSLPESPGPGPLSCCLCGSVLSDPISTSCGHRLCRQCLSSNWGQSHSCPLCHIPSLQRYYKRNLELRCESVSEGIETWSRTSLNRIYTELYITEGHSEEVSTQHEESQLETQSKTTAHDTPIRCHDIFKPLPSDQKPIRVVLTSGVAGVGKTFSVMKFTLDWTQGSENQEVDLVVPLSFRELNLVRENHYSLLTLIQEFHPPLQKLTAETLAQSKLLLIFDGLDESRWTLDFRKCKVITKVTQRSKLKVLLVNLINGSLLPSALIWITSRPAAASKISVQFVDRFTEVRGFLTNKQKEDYFRKKFTDEEQCDRVLSHIRTSRSLYIMCQIPVFCWITATVLDHMLKTEQRGAVPQTLTDMYAHFLLVQTQRKSKYRQETSGPELTQADCEVLMKLGRLAFNHLQKGSIMFYQEDLERVGLDLTEASVYSGLCTEIFKQESAIFSSLQTIYCFVHLSVQEFMAAVYMHHCFNNKKKRFLKSWKHNSTADVFLRTALQKAFKSPNGHLDLFVRFLHGLFLESNQGLLRALLGPPQSDSDTRQRIISNLKRMSTEDISPDRSINIFHCLTELNDHSVHQQIQDFLKSGGRSGKLSEIQCSALAYMLQMSDGVLEELDLKKYNTSSEGQLRLLPAMRNCRKAVLSDCKLSKIHLEVVTSALKSSPSHLRFLDLSLNSEVNSEIKVLCDGLRSPNCRLESLRLNFCNLSESSCSSLASALMCNPSHLKQLQLGGNVWVDSVVDLLCGFLQSPDCQLEVLTLYKSSLSEYSCSSLVSALKCNPSHLKKLDLGFNDLQESTVEHLCGFLQSSDCRLETLELNNCSLPKSSCTSLASALKSNPSHLRELVLWGNNLKEEDVQELHELTRSPQCRLGTLFWR